VLNRPPIDANAPYPANGSSTNASSRRAYPVASRSAGNAAASYLVEVMPSGSSTRDRTTSRYSCPVTFVMMRPRIAYPRFEYSNAVPHERERLPALQELGEGVAIEILLPITPGIVAREPGGHRQEATDRYRRRVGNGRALSLQLRDVHCGRVVQLQLPSSRRSNTVAAVKSGHRRDAEHRVGVGSSRC
jgi:hypothetical protein